MTQPTQQRIRDAAQQLADIRRGESRRRAQAREEAGKKYADADKEIQRRWANDRDALLAEYTRTCPFCGEVLEPLVHTRDARPPIGRSIAAIPERVTIHQRQRCGCERERIELERLEAEAKQENAFFDALQWSTRLSKAGLVGWLASATFDAYRLENHSHEIQHGIARQYCDMLLAGTLGDRPWLLFYGPFGTGKTHLAAAIIHDALRAGTDRCYLRVWPNWVEQLTSSFEDRDVSTSALLRELQQGKLLVLDDIDKQHPTKGGWVEEKLYTALGERFNRRLPTILIFNRSPEEMAPWLGKAIVDRLFDVLFQVVEFNGRSHRSALDMPWQQ